MNTKKVAKKEMTLDDLALIIARRFDEVDEKIDKGFKEVRAELKGDIAEVKADLTEVKADLAEVKTDLADVKVTVDNIEAELNKKVDRIDHNTLEYRVEKLEKKFA